MYRYSRISIHINKNDYNQISKNSLNYFYQAVFCMEILSVFSQNAQIFFVGEVFKSLVVTYFT